MKRNLITKAAALSLAIVALSLSACKKDKPGPTPAPAEKKLTSIEENGQRVAAFEYNANGSLKKLTTRDNPGDETQISFTYDAEKRLTEIATDNNSKLKYVYENGLPRLAESYIGNHKVGENIFVYENGRIKSNTMFMAIPKPDGGILYKPTFSTVYHYSVNGVLQKLSTYTANQATGLLELESERTYNDYDARKNPLVVMKDFALAFLYQPIQQNNSRLEKLYNAAGELIETTVNEYTYDAAGYPVTMKSTVASTGGTPTVINTKFNY